VLPKKTSCRGGGKWAGLLTVEDFGSDLSLTLAGSSKGIDTSSKPSIT
jgi:hypothetical protein